MVKVNRPLLLLFLCLPQFSLCLAQVQRDDLLAGHPRESYAAVADVGAMELALRAHLAGQERYSFSRSWWTWDRLRARYVDGGRKDQNALRILRGVFRGLLLDRHAKLQAKGEGDLLYLFHTTLKGDGKESVLDVEGRKVSRDLHGGGYHGGWGGAARMRIFLELAEQKMLTTEELARFKGIVHQSLEARFIDFKAKAQSANNHSFGNAGGIALALKHYPDAPQAEEAKAWIDRIWKDMADYGDWTEWTYYPYGPIFLHGLLDIAEATGRIESDKALINSVAGRCLGFVHGSGVRGNPNSGSKVRSDLRALYADPWNVGYYDVETSARDGHFWYRLAQHYRNSEYLWAAEQVALGGRPPKGDLPREYLDAYNRRFAWFVERKIEPRPPRTKSGIGLLGATKAKVQERLYLDHGRESGKPFAAFFLYQNKDEHLDNVSGHLYEYAANGAKFLHTSGKYNNVYSGNDLRGGGAGEESLDLFLVVHKRHEFPNHPDRQGDQRDFLRRGSIKHLPQLTTASNNKEGDAFGEYAFANYYGEGSAWIRRAILTVEGYLIVADHYRGGKILGANYQAGPVWHLALDEDHQDGIQALNWFDAPALDHAWWQKDRQRVLLFFHRDPRNKFGALKQRTSQDIATASATHFTHRPITAGQEEHFLSIFVPHPATTEADKIAATIQSAITDDGAISVSIRGLNLGIASDGSWTVTRK